MEDNLNNNAIEALRERVKNRLNIQFFKWREATKQKGAEITDEPTYREAYLSGATDELAWMIDTIDTFFNEEKNG